jgi:starch synthase
VASRSGGIPEIVDDGVTGLLVPVFDAGGLERAIRHLLADPEQQRRMGRVGREKVLARFSWESVVASLLGHYQRLLDEGGGAAPQTHEGGRPAA